MSSPPPTSSDERTMGGESVLGGSEATIDSAGKGAWSGPTEAAEASELTTGASLGRYTILRRLGAGAMGVVYSAYDADLDRKVAIKILHPRTKAVANGEEGKLRLLREAKALARLAHPNVVAIHDVGTFADRIFLAMEFVDGETLGAWLKRKRRTWREIVEILRKAGDGLAAAHRGGLIHRDFKPENVVLGHDGRVRVLDFGLARAADDIHASAAPPEFAIDASTSIKVEITSTGVLVGTPAYMAPEQHIGRGADARSDIFAFCVTLYQALYGERPFAGENLSVLAANVIQGKVRPPPSGVKVPSWLRRVVLQGLAVDPDQRFQSMEALLLRLDRDPRRLRSRWLGLVGVSALGVGIAVGTLGPREPPCQGAIKRLAGVWDPAVKRKIEAQFLATGVPYAAAAWIGLESVLDTYSGRWLLLHTEACEATHVLHEQSPEILDLQMLCLDRRLGELRALTALFSDQVTATVVENAVDGAGRLADVAACGDRQALHETVPLPRDPAVRERVDRVRRQLAEAKAFEVAGEWSLATARAEGALHSADTIAYQPLRADALLTLASLDQTTGDYGGALDRLRQAAEVAAAARYDEAVALAWIDALDVLGIRQASYDEALWAGHAADVGIRRLEGGGGGGRPLLRARLDLNLARVFQRTGDHAQAEAKAKAALEVFEEEFGEIHPLVPRALTVLALVAMTERDTAAAQERFDRALTIARRVSGPDHPSVASVLTNLALVAQAHGEAQAALGLADEALEIRRRALAPDHPDIAVALTRLGSIAEDLGRYDAAAAHYQEALEIYDRDPSANAPARGECLDNLGYLDFQRGDLVAAERHYRAAWAAFREALGDAHGHTATVAANLGEVMIHRGALDRGLKQLRPALDVLRRHDPQGVLPYMLTVAGGALQRSRDLAGAENLLREALALYTGGAASPPEELARARYTLATVLRDLRRDDAEIQSLIGLARAGIDGLGEEAEELRAEIDASLAEWGSQPTNPRGLPPPGPRGLPPPGPRGLPPSNPRGLPPSNPRGLPPPGPPPSPSPSPSPRP